MPLSIVENANAFRLFLVKGMIIIPDITKASTSVFVPLILAKQKIK